MANVASKSAARQRRERIQQVRHAWQRGDYRRARQLARAVYGLGPVEGEAQAELQRAANLPYDPTTVGLGLATTLLYLVAWGWAKFGDHAAGIARFG